MALPMPRAGARRSSARVDALRSVRKVLQPLPVALLAIVARGRPGHVRAA